MDYRRPRRIAVLVADAHQRARRDPPRPAAWTWEGVALVGLEVAAVGVIGLGLAFLVIPLVS